MPMRKLKVHPFPKIHPDFKELYTEKIEKQKLVIKLNNEVYKIEEQLKIQAIEFIRKQNTRERFIYLCNGYDTNIDSPSDFDLSDAWNCPKSPINMCLYNSRNDPCCDSCLFCGQPDERK